MTFILHDLITAKNVIFSPVKRGTRTENQSQVDRERIILKISDSFKADSQAEAPGPIGLPKPTLVVLCVRTFSGSVGPGRLIRQVAHVRRLFLSMPRDSLSRGQKLDHLFELCLLACSFVIALIGAVTLRLCAFRHQSCYHS